MAENKEAILHRHVLVLLAAILAALFASCGSTEPELSSEPYYEIFITAADEYYSSDSGRYIQKEYISVYAELYNATIIPSLEIKLNGRQRDLPWAGLHGIASDGHTVSDAAFFDEPFTGQKVLSLISSLGTVDIPFTIPGQTVFTSHATGDTIYADSAIELAWTGDAEYYEVQVIFDPWLISSPVYFVDTIVVANSVAIPANILASNGSLSVNIYPFKGSVPGVSADMVPGKGMGSVRVTNRSGFSSSRPDLFLAVRLR